MELQEKEFFYEEALKEAQAYDQAEVPIGGGCRSWTSEIIGRIA